MWVSCFANISILVTVLVVVVVVVVVVTVTIMTINYRQFHSNKRSPPLLIFSLHYKIDQGKLEDLC